MFFVFQRNATISTSLESTVNGFPSDEQIFWLSRISYMYYTMIGCLTVWIVSYPMSLLTKSDKEVDERLLAPFMRRKLDETELNEQTKHRKF